ncbi:MAG: hypothetical protein RL653_1844 [Pseudomonadota bacterium]
MGIPPDLIELLREFAAADVKYLVIGGYAQGFHAVPRFTKDVDFWLDPAPENIQRTIIALSNFGAPRETLEAVKALSGLDVAWLGHPPLRFDFMTSVPGGEFQSAWSSRVTTTWEGTPAHVVSRDWLLVLKRASGRPQDLVDVLLLEQGMET